MPCDALSYYFVCRELDTMLTGGRIEKINMPEPDEIFLTVRAERKSHTLVISAGNYPRVHITAASKDNPLTPPSLCMNLRKNIGGGVIKSITQLPDERVLFFDILCRDELGVKTDRRLVCELMGKYSNVILLEAGKIIECLRHIPLDISAKRQLLPGLKYSDPKQDKLSPFDSLGIAALNFDADPYKTVFGGVKGLAQSSITEALYNASIVASTIASTVTNSVGLNDNITKIDLANAQNNTDAAALSQLKHTSGSGEAIANSIKDLFEMPITPCVLAGEHGDFFVRPYKSIDGEYVFFDSLNLAMDFFYSEKDKKSRLTAKSKNLTTIVKNALRRAEKRLAEFYSKLNESDDFEDDRILGDLITANIYRVTPGMTTLTTTNFYSENGDDVQISIDPMLSPAANAQKYYKKYAKKKRTLVASRELADKAELDKKACEELLYSLSNLTSATELSDIAEEMAALSLIKPLPRRKNEKPSSPRTAEMDGFKIAIGKNNIQNERLYKGAAKNDIWLHAKQYHGSHVVIECGSRTVPQPVILAAAEFAAYYSSGGSAPKVEVDYTLIKNVNKQPGGGPGKVFYRGEQSIVVTPKPV